MIRRVAASGPEVRVEVAFQATPTYLPESHAWDHQTVEVRRTVTTYPVTSRGTMWSKGTSEQAEFTVDRADIPDLVATLTRYLADFTRTELEEA